MEGSVKPFSNIYRPQNTGLFQETVSVAGKTRPYLLYIPKRVRSATSGIMVFCDNGQTAQEVFEKSMWRILADCDDSKEQFVVAFLEAQGEGGLWRLDEAYGCQDGDVAYAMAVYAVMQDDRRKYCVHEAKHYLFGVGAGGVMANMTALWNPAVFSGIAAVGGSGVATAYLEEVRNAPCVDFNGFLDETHHLGIKKSEIPMPAWIIDDPLCETGLDVGIVEYWCNSCGITTSAKQIEADTWEYVRENNTKYPVDQDKEAYRVRVSNVAGAVKEYANDWLMRVWKDFLRQQRRWEGNAGGDLRRTFDPVRDLGAEYHYEEIGGFLREWYVYVPRQVRENADKSVPLVFAMHGYSCSGDIYMGHSGWHKVADKFGFIVVFPSAVNGHLYMRQPDTSGFAPLPAWNFLGIEGKPDELKFFKELYEKTCSEYNIDQTRVYATGHSHGSMMTHTLGFAMTDLFAAIAPCSGTMFALGYEKSILELDAVKKRVDAELPVWMFVGEEESWLIPCIPDNDNKTGLAISQWRTVNHMEPAYPGNWEENWCVYDGWHDLVYRNEAADPRVCFTWIESYPHAVSPRMAYRIWEEFFSKYRRVDGKVIYLR